MQNLTTENLVLAFLGMLIHVLFKISGRSGKKQQRFQFKIYFTDAMNWVRILLSISSAIALLIMSDTLCDLFNITLKNGTKAYQLYAFTAGYLNHSLIGNVIKVFNRSKERILNDN